MLVVPAGYGEKIIKVCLILLFRKIARNFVHPKLSKFHAYEVFVAATDGGAVFYSRFFLLCGF